MTPKQEKIDLKKINEQAMWKGDGCVCVCGKVGNGFCVDFGLRLLDIEFGIEIFVWWKTVSPKVGPEFISIVP